MRMLRDEERGLLRKGLTSYVDAASAVFEFLDLVQEVCKDILSSRLADVSGAFGAPRGGWDSGAIEGHPNPKEDRIGRWGWMETAAYVGASLNLEGRGTFWVGLRLRSEQDEEFTKWGPAEATVGLDDLERSLRDDLAAKLKSDAIVVWSGEIALRHPVPREDLSSFPSALGSALDRWFELWERGGAAETWSQARKA